MILLEDTRQQIYKHKAKHKWFAEHGIEIERCRLYVGDYTLPHDQSVCIDTKYGIEELVNDMIGGQHERFRAEADRAAKAGIRLIILVENKGGEIAHTGIYNPTIRNLSELHKWKNPRLFILKPGRQIGFNRNGTPKYEKVQAYPRATKGITLQKACYTFSVRHKCEFVFCTPEESAQKVLELLGVKYE